MTDNTEIDDRINAELLQMILLMSVEDQDGNKIVFPDDMKSILEEIRLNMIDTRDNGSELEKIAAIEECSNSNQMLKEWIGV